MIFNTSPCISLLLSSLSILVLASLASSTTISATPTQSLFPTESDVLGFTYQSDNGWFSPYHCPTSSAFIHGSHFGRCCTSDTRIDCPIATTCLDGSVMVNSDYRLTCTGTGAQTACVVGTLYHTPGDPSPMYVYQCWPTWTDGNWNATITVPDLQAIATSPPSTTAAATTSPSAAISSSPTTEVVKIVTSIISVASPAPTPSATAAASRKGLSGGAIAGIVVGVLVFAALLGLLVWRLRQQRNAPPAAPVPGMHQPILQVPSAGARVPVAQHLLVERQSLESLRDPVQPVQGDSGDAPPMQAPMYPRFRRTISL
ncbi:uncharacterized protein BDZ99DRAFT_577213 [Mytilinidion resinicola]|uniref:Mid2 domain-containing protein n=1 Tax=Mytilinidion resinicola TaxID=574789 RepID=A0A6A6Y190_9PEZI|nr:uncharacterized protein BDZ99DRAFT_577213 [Mytilinidion resinicola]KAF2801995.1 hypothetical protein BDZ99DRAFT_577213 [Mytilinidion resinicola]